MTDNVATPPALTILAQGTSNAPELPERYYWTYETTRIEGGFELTVRILRGRSPRIVKIFGESFTQVVEMSQKVDYATIERFPNYMERAATLLEQKLLKFI